MTIDQEERINRGGRIVANAERHLTEIRGELLDVLDDLNTLLDEGPKIGSYGHFVACFDLTMHKTIKPALRELDQCHHGLSELETNGVRFVHALAPNLTAMLERSMDCEVCE